ncbi:uncharacterized protein LOC101852736 [Aplysia californica]|uniref:Uncharacterized protein LOC101852736 n=1 Tax=Aplysia californica TaxID=6500 RepID=A0ABM0K7X1_APLCA|nr:uncharacterized protein LOC101852736 [Aplysia californica]
MADVAGDKTGSSSSTPPTDGVGGGPIIKESQESEEYQQDLQVVLGTAFGVIAVVGLIALTFLLYRVYRARQRALAYTPNDENGVFERQMSVDIGVKSQPVVLLLYANDCPIHERVVAALAGFLMEVCGVTVTLDLLEETDIMERGIDDWLVDKLQEADYILVICSVGARLRCSKKKIRFKSDSSRVLPDYFAVAVDYVAEKMRAEKQKGLGMNKFVTAYMEYSTPSDIPPQLESSTQFCLMKDIHAMHSHMNAQGPESDKSDSGSQHSSCERHYHETETGALLKATLEQAKTFFRENPAWMDECIEHIEAPFWSLRRGKAKKKRRNSMEQPLMLSGTPQVMSYQNHDNVLGVERGTLGVSPSALSHHMMHRSTSKNLPFHHSELMAVDPEVCSTLPRSSATSHLQKCGQFCLLGTGVSQGRQNSLPSSLASSCLIDPTSTQTMSKSMDSFARDSAIHAELDGHTCFFCNNVHMDIRSSCRRHAHARHKGSDGDLPQHSSLVSMDHSCSHLALPTYGVSPSRSHTILQAEVHQEWGHSNKGTPEKKSATLTGDPRSWSSDLDTSGGPLTPYQSLPPHFPPPVSSQPPDKWELRQNLHGWPDSSCHTRLDLCNPRLPRRSSSDVSISTDDSGSLSDGDSLERDLRSIQNISSFHDFVISSSFVGSDRSAQRSLKNSVHSDIKLPMCLKTYDLSSLKREDFDMERCTYRSTEEVV